MPATSVVFQDITCAAHGSDLWITYASGTAVFSPSQDSPGDAVSVVHSATGGDAFDQPVTVSNGGAGAQYLFPQIARSPAGDLLVAYYQRFHGETRSLAQSHRPFAVDAVSALSGVTPELKESEQPENNALARLSAAPATMTP